MSINLNFFVTLVHVSFLRLDGLTLVDKTMIQTPHALTPQLFCLSPRYQLTDIATSSLTSKDTPLFSHSDFNFEYKDHYSTLTLRTNSHLVGTFHNRLTFIFTA